jgi:hypothetical protein
MKPLRVRRSGGWTWETLIVATSLVAACAAPSPTPPEPLSGPTSVAPASSNALRVPHGAGEWIELASDSFMANEVEVLGVAGREAGAVIVGSIDGRASLWMTADLVSWDAVELPDGAPGSRATVAVATPDAVVVAGTGRGGRLAIWRGSGDGDWLGVPLEASTFPLGSTLRSLAWTGTMFVAVGSVARRPSEDLADNEVAAWTSSDGLAWVRVQLPTPPSRGGWLTDVSASNGSVVAGGTLDGGRSTESVVFVSPDGQSWALANPPQTPGDVDEYIASVGASPAAYLLTSRVVERACREADCLTGQGLTWLSIDGAEWELTAAESMPPAVFGATGHDFVSMAYSDPAFTVLRTTDGSTYQVNGDPFTPPDRIIVSGWALTDQGVLIAGVSPMDPTRVFAWKQS